MDGQAADVVAAQLHLAGVQAGPQLQAEVAAVATMASAQRTAWAGAAKRARIPSPVDLDEDAVVAGQQSLDVDVELVEDGAPLAVAHLGGAHGRVHDVGEEHRGEQARGGVRATRAR